MFRIKIRELLARRGMNQKDLALVTGLREATISEMVNDTRTSYNKKNLLRIMEALKVTDISEILEVIVIKE
ncbi:helix-turn-helix domain-containing protein [Ectobacillus ponti]|uniref:Helix-turn-helix transcriptional regulator n=1 Tax=Ectobacillus ponti TaxID=2961894 RepID=A0AA41XB78_9BACI|nr:helix-turn-helix transcriptional regulator [Ectobacillus ponti]MCP8970144.1 helix-turn-helix transcriptional regulator [Ectobacillus ponti]